MFSRLVGANRCNVLALCGDVITAAVFAFQTEATAERAQYKIICRVRLWIQNGGREPNSLSMSHVGFTVLELSVEVLGQHQ